MSNKKTAVLFLIALLQACTPQKAGPNDPKQTISEYISKSFSVSATEEKMVLAGYMTGEAKNRLQAWSDDQFRQAFMDSKRQFLKLVFREIQKPSDHEVNVTYELTYLDQSKGHDAKVTAKKLCSLVLDQGKWLISDVRNIKELVEYQNELSLP